MCKALVLTLSAGTVPAGPAPAAGTDISSHHTSQPRCLHPSAMVQTHQPGSYSIRVASSSDGLTQVESIQCERAWDSYLPVIGPRQSASNETPRSQVSKGIRNRPYVPRYCLLA